MIKEKPKDLFTTIADTYYSLTPTLPEAYVQLLLKTFATSSTDTIIDLGCGSGDLALALRNTSSFVQGIDISSAMIKLAEEKDKQKRVTWLQQPIEDFDLGTERYNLIISFDSFHIFTHQQELIQRCARALKPGGVLCIGWVMYAFDPPLQTAIEETFATYGVPWDDWGAWTCPTFPAMVKEAAPMLSEPQQKSVSVPARVSTKDILNYNFNVSKTASLSKDMKDSISQALWKKISAIFPSGESVGYDQYSLMYCKKL
jgi:ubiquinone/menaquinone biosynthesis C-methylase UbiE